MFNKNVHPEFATLDELFKSAWQFLQETEVNAQKLKQTPWYLLIGPQQAGKTAFIQEAELTLLPAKHLNIARENESQHYKRCNWWFNDKATVLDVPGNYFTSESQADNPIDWSGFLAVAKKYFKQKQLNGIILTLSLPDWLSSTKEQQQVLIQELRKLILTFTTTIKYGCPIYLVFTKLDKLAGFTEFFSDLGQEERRQPLGFFLQPLPAEKIHTLPAVFKKQFDQLLMRLHSRVIWRTHQERNLQKRVVIQHFPWQLESAKNSLSELLYQFADLFSLQGKRPLQGIYFVSSKQQDQTIDFLPKPLASHLVPTTITHELNTNKQSFAYFSQQLLSQIIFTDHNDFLNRTDLKKWYTATYLSAACMVGLTCIYLGYSFNTKLAHLNSAETAFIDYQLLAKQLPPTDTNLNQSLAALNALQQTVFQLQQAHLPVFIQDFYRSATLDKLAGKAYHQELVHYFLPGIQAMLENMLNNTSDPNLLYSGLKIYLMLGDPGRFDADAIRSWFKDYWGSSLTVAQQKNLQLHLNNLLASPAPPAILNQALITKVRITLNSLPASFLANILLRSNSLHNSMNISEQIPNLNKVFAVANNATTIPSVYTAQRFADIYFVQIPTACKLAINGDWVLGTNNNHPSAFNTSPGLITQVRAQYLTDYAAYWQKLITNLTIVDWQNWQQAQTTFDALLNKKSPLKIILQLINKNTSLANLVPSSFNLSADDAQLIQAQLVQNFQNINNLFVNNNGQPTNEVEHTLLLVSQLQQYFDGISPNSNKAAFIAAQLRFAKFDNTDPLNKLLTEASNLPAPLRNWLDSLGNNVWSLVLNHTTQYLNTTYQDQVVTYYLAHLDARYPLYKHSVQDISLEDFTNFFAQDGIINNFYQTNLATFIDSSGAQWHLRQLNGQSINITTDALTQLERANLIRNMFFNDNGKLSVTFSLIPVAIEPDVKKLTFNFDGNVISDHQSELSTPHFMHWPSQSKQSVATIVFTNTMLQQSSRTETGPWAIFHLFDDANLQSINANDTKNFELTFDLNGNAARYRLTAENLVNPFIPGIIEQFRAPQSLE